MARSSRLAALVLLSLALAACGGGGDESTGGGQVKAWSDPERISFENGNVSYPVLTAEANGNATAIFRDHDGTKWGAAVNHYTAGSGWGGPQMLSTTAADPGLSDYDIAAAPSGLVVAVWAQVIPTSGGINSVWTSRLPVGGTWTAPITLDSTSRDTFSPRVALDRSGAGTAIWRENAPNPATTDNIEAADASATGFWTTPYSIPDEMTDVTGPLALAANPNGRMFAAWSQAVGSGISLFASFLDGTTAKTWHTELVDVLSPPALDPDIEVNASGTAFLVWDQTEDGGNGLDKIWARRRPDSDTIGAWEAPVRLDGDTGGDAKYPRVAVDASGNALAVWMQSDGARNSIWADRYAAGSGWGTAQRLENTDDDTERPRIAIGPDGDAFAVWTRNEGGHLRVWSAHFTPGAGWAAPERLEDDAMKDASGPTVAYSDSGTAFAVWALSDPAASGVAKVWASQYR